MTKLHFKVDPNNLTLDDLIMIEEGNTRSRQIKELFSKFLVDDQGQPLPENEAKILVGKMSLIDLAIASEVLVKDLQEAVRNLVPTNSASE